MHLDREKKALVVKGGETKRLVGLGCLHMLSHPPETQLRYPGPKAQLDLAEASLVPSRQ